jgi:hypothetical protein
MFVEMYAFSNYEANGMSMEQFVEDYTRFAEGWSHRKDLLHFKKDIKYNKDKEGGSDGETKEKKVFW